MRKLIFTISIITTLTTSLFAETILTIGEREKSDIDYMPSNDVQDTLEIPQDPTQFSKQADPMSREEQLDYDMRYNEKYFEPWQLTEMDLSEGEKTWQFVFAKRQMYRRYNEKISKQWFKNQIKNSNFDNYDTISKPAIVTKHSDIKLYPTEEEFYYNSNRAGEGFPFDYNQNSSVYINTPIFVSHYSKDKEWVYIKTSFAFGWIKVDNMAFVTDKFKEQFQTDNYGIVTTDNLDIYDDNQLLSLVKLGSIFPIDKVSKKYIVAKRGTDGYAIIKKFRPTEVNLIAKKPIKFNSFNIAFIGKQLVNKPYGWGGKLKTRDCSALTRDFFAPFGIYLPRNSSQQAKESDGVYMSLAGMSKEEKTEAIMTYGKPCRSLLFVPGHIMLYLGKKDNEPIIMHDYWGVRLKNGKKHILGRSVITTTKPGKEMANVKEKSMLINTFKGLVNF
ncbi:Putative lipoprotein [hydrothermal vent metagenome]|uniref:Putative lipoprotein n=1 Tax=hydrothermal vent metagenome TaxID=652676 RepID=A0A1W1C3G4_9ZZZZ